MILFDNSLSMQWEKLERSYAALEKILYGLTPADHFNLLLFNQEVNAFQPQAVVADSVSIQRALDFVRASRLRGGTDLGKALHAGFGQATLANSSLILLTDGGSDRGTTVLTHLLAANYAPQWKQSPQHPRTDVFAVGDDANLPLLRQLARNDGVFESVLSTEPIDAKLASFLARIRTHPIDDLHLAVEPNVLHTLYPLDDCRVCRRASRPGSATIAHPQRELRLRPLRASCMHRRASICPRSRLRIRSFHGFGHRHG